MKFQPRYSKRQFGIFTDILAGDGSPVADAPMSMYKVGGFEFPPAPPVPVDSALIRYNENSLVGSPVTSLTNMGSLGAAGDAAAVNTPMARTTQNAVDCLLADGTGHYVTATSLEIPGPITIVQVMRYDGPNDTSKFASAGRGSSAGRHDIYKVNGDWSVYAGAVNALTDQSPFAYIISTLNGSESFVRKDRVSYIKNQTHDPFFGVRYGSFATAVGNQWHGLLCEYLIFDGLYSSLELNSLIAELEEKWALDSSLLDNLLNYSEDFTHSIWGTSGVAVIHDSTTPPAVAVTADTLSGNTTSQAGLTQTKALKQGIRYSMSIYAKQGTSQFLGINPDAAIFGSGSWAIFNLATGLVEIQAAGGTGALTTMTNEGDGWYRCEWSAIADVDGESLIPFAPSSASSPLVLEGTQIFTTAAQLSEDGLRPYEPRDVS